MSTQHIGAAGELLVQYRLLKRGIDSARLTTDSGIDLVVYSTSRADAVTVQVKTQAVPLPAGGRGALTIGVSFPHELRAQVLAVASLATDDVWLFTRDEARSMAQEHNLRTGQRRLYWYLDPPGSGRGAHTSAYLTRYKFEQSAPALFA